MEQSILISYLNDFIFCPVSIYFHELYQNIDDIIYKDTPQINGSKAHYNIDNNIYSSSKEILQGIDVYSRKYDIIGKIDILNLKSKTLIERKKKIKKIYDGYIFQMYAQYFALKEMGYEVDYLKIHSMDDNKNYFIELPDNNKIMKEKFEKLIYDIKNFDIEKYVPFNKLKCKNCIYEPACDRSIYARKK